MNTKEIEYCYSLDEEMFNHETIGDVIGNIVLENPVGATYWRGEKQAITHADCIDVDAFLEQLDEQVYEEIGEVYDNNFSDVNTDAKKELNDLILAWSQKHVSLRYWKVLKVTEMKITEDDTV